MLLALALAAVLSAEADAAEAEVPDALKPREVEPAPELLADPAEENERVARIGATALGGALGIAVPLLVGWGWKEANGPCMPMFFGGCPDTPMGVMSSFIPFTAAVGLGVAHTLRGGKAGIGFGLGGALSGYMVSTGALGLVSALSGTEWAKSAPGPGAGFIVALSLVGAVAALEARHSELQAGAKPWLLGRSLAAGAAFWLPATLVEFLLTLGSVSLAYGNSGAASALLLLIGTVANLGLAAAAGAGAHRALDGKGTYWSALVGTLASSTIAALFLTIHAHAPPRGGVYGGGGTGSSSVLIPVTAIAVAIAAVGPSVALEWSSSVASAADPAVVPPPDDDESIIGKGLQVSAGFGPNGSASLGLSGSF